MKIQVSMKVSLQNSQTIKTKSDIYQESYEVAEFEIPAGAVDLEANIAPIDDIDDLAMLYIMADYYPSTPTDLSYKIHSAGNPSIRLDSAQIFAGEGQVRSFASLPDKLFFSNSTTRTVNVTVAIARNVASSNSSESSISSLSSNSSSLSSESSASSFSGSWSSVSSSSSSAGSKSSESSSSISSVSSQSSFSSDSSASAGGPPLPLFMYYYNNQNE